MTKSLYFTSHHLPPLWSISVERLLKNRQRNFPFLTRLTYRSKVKTIVPFAYFLGSLMKEKSFLSSLSYIRNPSKEQKHHYQNTKSISRTQPSTYIFELSKPLNTDRLWLCICTYVKNLSAKQYFLFSRDSTTNFLFRWLLLPCTKGCEQSCNFSLSYNKKRCKENLFPFGFGKSISILSTGSSKEKKGFFIRKVVTRFTVVLSLLWLVEAFFSLSRFFGRTLSTFTTISRHFICKLELSTGKYNNLYKE